MEILTAPPDPKDVPVTGGKRRVPLKLLDAIRLGMTDNIEVKKGILDRATSVENLLLAERIFEPEFNLTGGYAYNAGSDQDNRNLGVEVTKRLETAGRLSFSWNQANILDRNAGSDRQPGHPERQADPAPAARGGHHRGHRRGGPGPVQRGPGVPEFPLSASWASSPRYRPPIGTCCWPWRTA